MKLTQQLAALGFSERESKVYVAMLGLGESSVQSIARQANEKRTTLYETIESLKEKGLVSETKKGKRRYFIAAQPSRLQFLFVERERVLQDILPLLKSLQKGTEKTYSVRVYEGVTELKRAYEDTIRSKPREILSIASMESAVERMGWEWTDKYTADRIYYNITVRFLTTESDAASKVASKDARELRETRFIHRKKLGTDIKIYGDKVLISTFKDKCVGLLIENSAIAEALRVMFEVMWEGAADNVATY